MWKGCVCVCVCVAAGSFILEIADVNIINLFL